MDSRALVEAALAAGDAPGALRIAREHLGRLGSDAVPACYPLLDPERAEGASGVRLTACWDDGEIASTARLVPGMMQFADWARPFRPPTLRRLLLDRCVALAPNVVLTAAGELLDDNVGFSNSELCRHAVAGFPGIAAAQGQIVLAPRHRETIAIDGPAAYLPVSQNYSAWLLGDLARLAAFAEDDRLPIVLHGDAADVHFDSLAAVGVGRDRLIPCGSGTRLECRELHYSTPTYFHHAPSPRGLAFLRMHVATEAPGASGGPARVYFSRRKIAGSRVVLNETELVSLLEGCGFAAVDPEALPFAAQARLAGAADALAGPYGANLANCAFARNARTALIVATKGQPEFSRLFSALAIPHWHVAADPVELRKGRTFSESYGFRVDLAAAATVLGACLAGG
jgi:hypothetical protein